MINGKRKTKLTPESVLDKITDYDIFRFYMPDKTWKLNRVTYSPFRNENNPSFVIGNKRGFISFIDFADTSKRGDCFEFVKLLHNLSSMNDVLKIIDGDFGLGIVTKGTKDYMVMKKIFPCSCAVQNEGVGCFSPENLEYLKANSDRQILSFDSDVTGVTNSQQITKLFDFDYANVPRKYLAEGIKDWADLAKAHGLQSIEDYLKQKHIL